MVQKIKLVVIDNHTLGCIDPNSDYATVLHTSILRGSNHGSASPITAISPMFIKGKEIRLASKQDFEEFRVSMNYFDNPNEYEFKN